MAGVGRLFGAIAVTALFCLPLAVSVWALLDCVRHPQWAWALSGRRQVVWLVAILFGFISVIGGLAISLWYLIKVRPLVSAAERGVMPES